MTVNSCLFIFQIQDSAREKYEQAIKSLQVNLDRIHYFSDTLHYCVTQLLNLLLIFFFCFKSGEKNLKMDKEKA